MNSEVCVWVCVCKYAREFFYLIERHLILIKRLLL